MTAGVPFESAMALYGRPTASELIEAARNFLAEEALATTEGRVRFHLQVTIRVLDTVARQLRLADAHLAEHTQRLSRIGYANDQDLVAAIRAGAHDGEISSLAAILQADVRAKLEVADPRYLYS